MRDVEPRTFHGAAMAGFPVVLIGQQTSVSSGEDRFGEHHVLGISSTNFLTTEEYACLAGRVMIRPG
jgi:hypothetical protein